MAPETKLLLAQYELQKATLDRDHLQWVYERNLELFNQNAGYESELELREHKLALDKAQIDVQVAQVAVHEAMAEANKRGVTSPESGDTTARSAKK